MTTTEQVRDAYTYATGSGDGEWTESRAHAEFDRWFADVQAKAWDEAIKYVRKKASEGADFEFGLWAAANDNPYREVNS